MCEEISVNNQIFYDNELAEGLFKSFPPCFIYNSERIACQEHRLFLALDNNIKSFDEQNITVSAGEKTYSYKYKGKFSADNETEVLNHICNMSKGFVLYTQNAEKYGFSSGYTAYIYEEVAE